MTLPSARGRAGRLLGDRGACRRTRGFALDAANASLPASIDSSARRANFSRSSRRSGSSAPQAPVQDFRMSPRQRALPWIVSTKARTAWSRYFAGRDVSGSVAPGPGVGRRGREPSAGGGFRGPGFGRGSLSGSRHHIEGARRIVEDEPSNRPCPWETGATRMLAAEVATPRLGSGIAPAPGPQVLVPEGLPGHAALSGT